MDKIVISSSRESAGKTSIIVGLAKAMGKTYGYIKPFGDRLLYRKKRLWDYDAALVTQVLGLHESPEDITIGFEHSKLRYMYDEVRIGEKVKELVANTSKNKDLLFVEGGKDLSYGVSVHLDAVSLAQNIGGKLIVVVSGNDDSIVDDIMFIKNYVGLGKVDFRGVIINKVHDIEDFTATYLPAIEKTGVKVLGIVPMQPDLKNFTVGYLSECLFAKVIAGEGGLNNVVKTIFVVPCRRTKRCAIRSSTRKTVLWLPAETAVIWCWPRSTRAPSGYCSPITSCRLRILSRRRPR
ncbi:MAG: hypothetical protein EHM32_04480 [Spirochaetales bacterium]|nr:MAG: hypothetical protein EHM32_04480 [Spirochaetales bacterium]